MRKWLMAAMFLWAGTASSFVFAHGKHVHGEAEMNVVLDGNELIVEVHGPLDGFLGFEHMPKNETQKKALLDMTGILQQGGTLFSMNPEAACSYTSGAVRIRQGKKVFDPAMLQTFSSAKKGGHLNLDASYSFTCKNPDSLRIVTVQLFERFNRLQKLETKAVLPKRQAAAVLTPRQPTLSW